MDLPYPFAEHAAVRHVLAAPLIAHRTAPYVDEEDVDFEGLVREAETMPGGGQLLVGIAYELWNAEKTIGLWEIVRRLDERNFERVLEALRISRGLGSPGLLADSLRAPPDEELAA
jgi:hypothetical protein